MAHWILMPQLTGCQSVGQVTAIHFVSFALALPGQLPIQLFTSYYRDYKVHTSLITRGCWDGRRGPHPMA